MKSTYEYKKMIHADDRATMLNLMVGLNGYTLCSGIICEELNGNDYAAVPLAESEKMRIGYIRHKGIKVSPIGELYVDILKKVGTTLIKIVFIKKCLFWSLERQFFGEIA